MSITNFCCIGFVFIVYFAAISISFHLNLPRVSSHSRTKVSREFAINSYNRNVSDLKKKIVSFFIASQASTLILTIPEVAKSESNPSLVKSIENIERVYDSLKFVQDDINNKGDAKDIIKQIKFLLNNYKLKDNIILSIELVDSSKKSIARDYGINAVEDLTQVYEYYFDEVDNMSGNTFPPKEVLTFANDAINAARKELNSLKALYPAEVLNDVDKKLASEL